MIRLAAVVVAAVLAGCAGGPVGYGGTDQVVFSNADTIKIQWDNLTTNEEAVRAKAVAHCGGRAVEVIDASSDPLSMGLVRSRTWRCVNK